MSLRVVFSPEAEEQLLSLYRHIATAASPAIATRYTGGIVDFCESLQTFPYRGMSRDDVRPGLRITGYRKRVLIAYAVDAEALSIIGIFYGGQDYETLLQEEITSE